MFKTLLLILALLLPAAGQEIPLRFLPGSEDGLIQGHLFTVPVRIGDYQTEFILDTGIGVDLISSKLAKKLGVPATNVTLTGQRMSGQAVTIPLSWLPSLTMGKYTQKFVTVGVFDFDGFLPKGPEWDKIEGFVSLNFFRYQPFSIDYAHQCLRLELGPGTPIELTLKDEEGVSLTAFANLDVNGTKALVEIDTGSDSLILHNRYLPPGLTVKTVNGKDETDNRFTRRFGTLPGFIDLNGFRRENVRVMFQDIIHDGLIGHDFLKNYLVSFDLAHSLMRLQNPSSSSPDGSRPDNAP